MKPSQALLRTLAVAMLPLLWCGTAFAEGSISAVSVPELNPGIASGGIALVAVAGILLLERYRGR